MAPEQPVDQLVELVGPGALGELGRSCCNHIVWVVPVDQPKLAGVVLADQVKNLDWRVRKAEFICKLARETTNEVLDKLGTLLIDES